MDNNAEQTTAMDYKAMGVAILAKVSYLTSITQMDDAYDITVYEIQQLLSPRHREQLKHLTMDGPLWDGDICSKTARDDLIDWSLAVRVAVKGEQGYTAATYRGYNVHRATKGA